MVRNSGLTKFGTDAVTRLELGRRETITVAEFVALTSALGVEVDSWFEGEGPVRWDNAEEFTTLAHLRAFFSGLLPGEWQLAAHFRYDAPTRAEARAARHLLCSPDEARRLARELWNRSFDEERDARLPGDWSTWTDAVLRRRRQLVSEEMYAEMDRRWAQIGADQAAAMAREWDDEPEGDEE